MLWASRQGRVLAALPPVPAMEILGGFWGPARRTDPNDSNFPEISDLVAQWSDAMTPADAARLATESARRTLMSRGPAGDPTPALMRDIGALGMVIAHTGSARGLIFGRGETPDGAAASLRRAGFAGVVRFRVGERV
jgi:hypothetical protein